MLAVEHKPCGFPCSWDTWLSSTGFPGKAEVLEHDLTDKVGLRYRRATLESSGTPSLFWLLLVITRRRSIAPGSVGLGGFIAILHSLLSLPFHLQVLWSLVTCPQGSLGPLPRLQPHVSVLLLFSALSLYILGFCCCCLFFCKKKELLLKVKGFRLTNRKGRTKNPKPQRDCSVGRQSESPQRAGLGAGLVRWSTGSEINSLSGTQVLKR